VKAAQAGVDRAGVLVKTVDALVKSQLRPGAELSRVRADEAGARTQLIRAQQAVDEARATLAQFVGREPAQIDVSAGPLLKIPSETSTTIGSVVKNPLALEQNAVVEESKARLHVLERSYFPRFNVQGTAYARGTAALPNGAALGSANGLGPSVQNYAIGFTATLPLFDLPSLRAKEAAQSAALRAERSRYEQVVTELRGKLNIARAQLEGARRIAENTPLEVEAARAATRQAGARYQSGLGTIVEVADAQRLLTEAEIDDGLARLAVWRAKLTVAAAEGDLRPFLEETGK
jgi:outer membrane protein TolC